MMGFGQAEDGLLPQTCERVHLCGTASHGCLCKDTSETADQRQKWREERSRSFRNTESCTVRQWIWFFIKVFAWSSLAVLLFLVIVVKGVPWVLSKVIIPLLRWEAATFSKPMLAIVIFLSLALCHAVFLPQGPSVWLAGIMFGFKKGLLLVLVGITVGFSIPFFIGRWLLQERMMEWFLNRPQYHNVLKLADRGGWGHQFKVVLFMRVSPLPSTLFNYLVTVTNIGYGPYIAASMVAGAPEAAINLYSGVLLKSLSDYEHRQHKPSKAEMIAKGVGLIIAVVMTIGMMLYGRSALQQMEAEDDEKAQEADAEAPGGVGFHDRDCYEGERRADGCTRVPSAANHSDDVGRDLSNRCLMSAEQSLKQPFLQGSGSDHLGLKIKQ